MRKFVAVLVLLAATLLSVTPAEAFWRHHCGRGWGGYGYRGGYGGYRGYYRGWGYGSPGWGYGGWGYSGYGNPYYASSYPSYNSYSMYSPYYLGASNVGTYNAGIVGSANNPLYGTANRAPAMTYVSSPSSFTAPVFAAKPTATPASPVPAPAAATPIGAAVQKFLGLGQLRPVAPVISRPITSAKPVAPIVNSIVSRFSNVDSRRKAEKLITEADELFKAQNFHSALQKYKLAASTAPDMPEAFWRQGHALVATHNYELAATAFKRAIALSEDLGRGGFRLSDIYGSANMTKQQHLESLAEWATSKRNSSDPYFLIGLFLEYDGQPARAGKFFQKANELAGISGGHIAVFLDPVAPSLLKSIERAAATPVKEGPVLPVVTVSATRDI
ncbi:MAG TPA: tetratricopeptide repeat protein [Pirellulaceae bacterium]|jgi:tetratricopeptide (TPR) repeat protein